MTSVKHSSKSAAAAAPNGGARQAPRSASPRDARGSRKAPRPQTTLVSARIPDQVADALKADAEDLYAGCASSAIQSILASYYALPVDERHALMRRALALRKAS